MGNTIRFLVILSLIWSVVSYKQQLTLPNILLVLSDDQDTELHGLHPLQQTIQLFSKYGTQFANAFTSTPICCPSRASILTGQYAHNHRTFNNSLDGGCNGLLWRKEFEPRALPALLQKHGYKTFFAGKYLNQFKGAEVPPGWHEFHGLHGNSRYYNYTLRENTQNVSYTDTYLTDLLSDRAAAFIRSTISKERQKPFFAMISPPAAHEPFTPAPRHAGAFADVLALRTPSFNAPFRDKHWLVGSGQNSWNNTYACVRDFRYNLNRIYCEFQDSENFVEAYDLARDPYQLHNIGYDMLPIERALYSILLKNLTKCVGKAMLFVIFYLT
ncbi:hypothetical protein ACLKA6_002002 [Drosophila palustris]